MVVKSNEENALNKVEDEHKDGFVSFVRKGLKSNSNILSELNKNQWENYKSQFNNIIDNKDLIEFLNGKVSPEEDLDGIFKQATKTLEGEYKKINPEAMKEKLRRYLECTKN